MSDTRNTQGGEAQAEPPQTQGQLKRKARKQAFVSRIQAAALAERAQAKKKPQSEKRRKLRADLDTSPHPRAEAPVATTGDETLVGAGSATAVAVAPEEAAAPVQTGAQQPEVSPPVSTGGPAAELPKESPAKTTSELEEGQCPTSTLEQTNAQLRAHIARLEKGETYKVKLMANFASNSLRKLAELRDAHALQKVMEGNLNHADAAYRNAAKASAAKDAALVALTEATELQKKAVLHEAELTRKDAAHQRKEAAQLLGQMNSQAGEQARIAAKLAEDFARERDETFRGLHAEI